MKDKPCGGAKVVKQVNVRMMSMRKETDKYRSMYDSLLENENVKRREKERCSEMLRECFRKFREGESDYDR